MTNVRNQYVPDHVSLPGETLQEALEERGMKQVELAQRIGMSRKHIKQIMDGEAPITPETALKLERALGIPARFWNNREQQYRDFLARKAEEQELGKWRPWLAKFEHMHEMVKRGWLPDADTAIGKIQALLDFFGVASPEAWCERWEAIEVRYRRSRTYDSDLYALAAWLRQGEVRAQDIVCAPYDEARFRATLGTLRALTMERPEVFEPKLVKLCAECGVAVVFVPELPKTASGATRWLSASKALIQLSLKYRTDDQLWFTFFHEAAHILLHPKKDIFIETEEGNSKDEDEANRLAVRTLMSEKEFAAFIASHETFSKKAIVEFAERQGIAPGIVVGQLQHAGHLPFSYCNDLKRRFKWRIVENN